MIDYKRVIVFDNKELQKMLRSYLTSLGKGEEIIDAKTVNYPAELHVTTRQNEEKEE